MVMLEYARPDLSMALIDSSCIESPEGGRATGPNPTDRRKKAQRGIFYLIEMGSL